jgi:hypothetical protein
MAMAMGLPMAEPLLADLIPSGHKAVTHQLVFVDSPALAHHRLVAAPVRGLHGTTEVVAGQPFQFSSKYGTRLYLIPKDVMPLPKFDRDLYSQWPSEEPPVGEITSVPMVNPVASILTKVRLVSVTSGPPEMELVAHEELDDSHTPVSWKCHLWRPLVLVPAGTAILLLTVRILKKRRAATP